MIRLILCYLLHRRYIEFMDTAVTVSGDVIIEVWHCKKCQTFHFRETDDE